MSPETHHQPTGPPPPPCRVAVVDRASLDRDLFVHAIAHAEGFVLAVEVPTLVRPGGGAIDLADGIDAVVLRAGAPGPDLVAEVTAAAVRWPGALVVVVAAYLDAHLASALVAAGAASVVSTETALSDLLDRVGGAPASQTTDTAGPDVAGGRHGLTPREHEVLHHLADGMTPKQIARLVDLRLSTVRDHVRSLREKLDCATATELVVVAHRLGLAPHVGRPLR